VLLSKKVLIMPSPQERERADSSRESLSPQAEKLPLAPGQPILPSDLRLVFTALDLYRSLGKLEKAVEVLEVAKTQHEKDLNGLGRVAHTASLLGKIALGIVAPVVATIIIAVLVSIYHVVEKLLLLK
jgi:hypothetical protein